MYKWKHRRFILLPAEVVLVGLFLFVFMFLLIHFSFKRRVLSRVPLNLTMITRGQRARNQFHPFFLFWKGNPWLRDCFVDLGPNAQRSQCESGQECYLTVGVNHYSISGFESFFKKSQVNSGNPNGGWFFPPHFTPFFSNLPPRDENSNEDNEVFKRLPPNPLTLGISAEHSFITINT